MRLALCSSSLGLIGSYSPVVITWLHHLLKFLSNHYRSCKLLSFYSDYLYPHPDYCRFKAHLSLTFLSFDYQLLSQNSDFLLLLPHGLIQRSRDVIARGVRNGNPAPEVGWAGPEKKKKLPNNVKQWAEMSGGWESPCHAHGVMQCETKLIVWDHVGKTLKCRVRYECFSIKGLTSHPKLKEKHEGETQVLRSQSH